MKQIVLFICLLGVCLLNSCQEEDVIPIENIEFTTDVFVIKEGEEVALKVNFTPNNATDRYINWDSSNEEVAMFTSDGFLKALSPGQTMLTATTRDGKLKSSCTLYVVGRHAGALTERTVLVYIAGDNNLARLAKKDVEEMKKGMLSLLSSSMHLLIYADWGDGDARLIELSNDNGNILEQTIREYGDRNSTGVEETREVFDDVFGNPDYQAASYGLIYWSHCDGWIPYPMPSSRWIGQDTGNGDNRMNLSDFEEILEQAPHFDFIMFDACFMQSIEVAYALRDYTDYYIASPTETPGPGAPYDKILPYMFQGGASAKLADTYYNVYADLYDEGRGITNDHWTGGTSICALRTEGLEQLASLTARLLPEEAVDVETLQAAAFDYDQRQDYPSSYVGYFDWAQMMQALLSAEDYAAWRQTFDDAIAYWNTTPMNYSAVVGMFSMEGTNGVTHYIPRSLSSEAAEAYRATAWYQAAGLSKLGW